MHRGAPRPHRRGLDEGGVGHAEGVEHPRPQHGVEPLAGNGLDHLPRPVDSDPVFPLLARIEQQRRHQPAPQAQPRVGLAVLGGEALQRRAEIGIAEARGVQHQHPGRHVALRRPEFLGARSVKTLEHQKVADGREIAFRRRVEVEAAVLDQLQHRRPGDRLGAGEQREHAVGRHRLRIAEPARAGRPLVDGAAAVGDHGDDAGNARLAGRRPLQDRVGYGGEFGVHGSVLGRPAEEPCG